MQNLSRAILEAVRAVLDADSLIVTAGAGMGVDSGLPDFRGPGGFWGVYPALGRAGIRFESIADPTAFRSMPAQAWGFYGHRLAMYREVVPGPAFRILQDIGCRKPGGMFAFTSNVDGHFQRAGVAADRVWECHGSIHHLQCLDGCMGEIWPAEGFVPIVDTGQCRLINEPPRCPHCGELARPNILMLNDWEWISYRSAMQKAAYRQWRTAHAKQPVVIEIGAGTAIPTVRHFSEEESDFLIRINPAEPELGKSTRGVALRMTGTQAMGMIADALLEAGWQDHP